MAKNLTTGKKPNLPPLPTSSPKNLDWSHTANTVQNGGAPSKTVQAVTPTGQTQSDAAGAKNPNYVPTPAPAPVTHNDIVNNTGLGAGIILPSQEQVAPIVQQGVQQNIANGTGLGVGVTLPSQEQVEPIVQQGVQQNIVNNTGLGLGVTLPGAAAPKNDPVKEQQNTEPEDVVLPAEPAPTVPAPAEPAPTVPAPAEPAPTVPTPAPAPTVPAPEQTPAVTLPQTGPLILPELAAPQITAKAPDVDIAAMRSQLQQWQDLLNQQTQAAIDRNVQQAVTDLQRAEQDAQGKFKEQAESVALDEAQGMDNSALYAEARGDKGGIGQAQYNAIQAAAAQNRLNVQQQQTKLSTDTARQIADLRAKGEFEKADAVLETAQTYLTKLTQLEQWAAEYGMSAAQFEAQMQKWQAEYDMALAELKVNVDKYNNEFNYQVGRDSVSDTQWGKEYDLAVDKYNTSIALDEQNRLADLGLAMLKAGVMPSPDQLRAMGISEQDAQASILAAQMSSAAPSSTSNPLGTSGASSVTELYGMLKKAGVKSGDEALSYLTYWGVADPKNYMTGYEAWLDGNGGGGATPKNIAGVEQELDILVANNGYSGARLLEQILSYGLNEEDTLALAKKYGL